MGWDDAGPVVLKNEIGKNPVNFHHGYLDFWRFFPGIYALSSEGVRTLA